MSDIFKYELGQNVTILVSGEYGEIIGRADYTNHTNMYQIRYKAADGRAVESWWDEDALIAD